MMNHPGPPAPAGAAAGGAAAAATAHHALVGTPAAKGAPFTRGCTAAVPAPFVASLEAFGDAGLECADLIVSINGVRFGDDHGGRWWEYPATAAAATAIGGGAGSTGAAGTAGGGEGGDRLLGGGVTNNGDDGGGGPAAAPPGRGSRGGKEDRSIAAAVAAAAGPGVRRLPFVELGVLRATGETSNSVMHDASPAIQKAWVALRLLQRQQSLATSKTNPKSYADSPLDRENLDSKNRAVANSLVGDAVEVSARLERCVAFKPRGKADRPLTAVAAKIKESLEELTKSRRRHNTAGTLPNGLVSPEFVPSELAYDLSWQVAAPVPAGHKVVRQLVHVNGVEADELTLAEEEEEEEARQQEKARREEALAEARAEALRRRNDPEAKAKRKAIAEAAAAAARENRVEDPCPGLVVWAELASGQRWPSLIQENLEMDRCLIRYLGPPPEQPRRPGDVSPTAAGPLSAETEEVEASSLVKFPGGQSLVVTGWELLAPLDAKASKQAKDDHIKREVLLPANEGRKGLQLAIDHAVRSCCLHSWDATTRSANVLIGKTIDALGLSKKERVQERKNRINSFSRHPDQWLLPEDTWKSYERFRIMFNKRPDEDPICQKLRDSHVSLSDWIRRVSPPSQTPAAATPATAGAPAAAPAPAPPPAPAPAAATAPTDAASGPGSKKGSPPRTPTPVDTAMEDGGVGGGDREADEADDDPHGGAGGAAAAGDGGTSAKGKDKGKAREGNMLRGSPSEAEAEAEAGAEPEPEPEPQEAESSDDDDASGNAAAGGGGKGKKGKGKGKRVNGSAGAAAEAGGGGGDIGGVVGAGAPPGLAAREGEGEPYSTEELVERMNALYSKVGITLDVDFYNDLLGQRAKVEKERARAEAATAGAAAAAADDGSGGGGAAASKGGGKRKAAGGAGQDADGAADRSKRAATSSGKEASRKRRARESDPEESDGSSDAGDAAAPLRRAGSQPGAGGDRAQQQQQQRATKRRKDCENGGGGPDGDDSGDFGCGGDDDGDDVSCGEADGGDGSMAPPPPPRQPSIRREGTYRPGLERAKVKAALSKGKASAGSKLRDKIQTGAAGGGSGNSYLIPKKAFAAGTPAFGGGDSSVGGGGGGAIPRRPNMIPKKQSSFNNDPGRGLQGPKISPPGASDAGTGRSGKDDGGPPAPGNPWPGTSSSLHIHQGPKMIVKLVKKVGAALKSALKLHSRDALNSLPLEQQHCCRDTWARMVIAQHGAIHIFPSISW
eukprot:g11301.t1